MNQRGHVDNRATRRRTAATTRHTKNALGELPPAVLISRTARAGTRGQPVPSQTREEADELEALVVSYCFDSGETGEPHSATVRLTGRHSRVQGLRKPHDDFEQEDRIEGILSGTGPVSITSWVYGLNPGEWTVKAELLAPDTDGRRDRSLTVGAIQPAEWSWRRWTLTTGSSGPLKTRWAKLAPLAKMPGVVPGSWPVLGALGVLVALVTLAAILAHEDGAVAQSMLVFLVALASGMTAAKVWYAVLHPGPWRQAILGGWAVDGFLLIAPLAAIAALLAFDLPVGTVLDAAAPGMFFGVAIGRVGCFLTGCCAGRISRSRWSVWSSDRRIGARRIPAQLMESAAGLMIGVAAALLVLGHPAHMSGAVFVGALAVYFIVRQALLRVRAERREFSWRRRTNTGLTSA